MNWNFIFWFFIEFLEIFKTSRFLAKKSSSVFFESRFRNFDSMENLECFLDEEVLLFESADNSFSYIVIRLNIELSEVHL